jgi:hypothetical protein
MKETKSKRKTPVPLGKARGGLPRSPVPLLGGARGGSPRLSIEAQIREAELGCEFLRYEIKQQRTLLKKLYRRIEQKTGRSALTKNK